MVLSKQFAQLSAEKFTFFAVNLKKVDELAGEEKDQIKKLISDNEVTGTPTLLFLDAETLARTIHQALSVGRFDDRILPGDLDRAF